MVLRIVLGTVYTAMAIGQFASFEHMPRILSAYGLSAAGAATALAAALIAGELVCGVWFLARPRSKALAPVWVYTGVSVVWTVLAVQAYARGLVVDNCGCFGIYLTQRLSWFVLLQDAATLLYAGLLVRSARRAPAPSPADRKGASGDVRVP
ncbi:MauE/DoxX family redox-associated membrane protein [Streptomyces sp. NBRC 110465]|uniref:MauE/DoxX family redox-associated membrane protein n=1 Tax=Streptomyces sp. NBRC 110465 TaxID=1897621 RepID=UPI000933BDD7|nr:MauE/DoxX family redox-associated membrane protein [Streptomyces sp. NBRC 110465]